MLEAIITNNYNNDKFMKEFNVNIEPNMVKGGFMEFNAKIEPNMVKGC